MTKLKECQKEFLINSRNLPNLRAAQQPSDREKFSMMVKRLCKYTGNTIIEHLSDEVYTEDYIISFKDNLEYMFNKTCENCEYCDFF